MQRRWNAHIFDLLVIPTRALPLCFGEQIKLLVLP